MAADAGQAHFAMLTARQLSGDILTDHIRVTDQTSGLFAFNGVFGIIGMFLAAVCQLTTDGAAYSARIVVASFSQLRRQFMANETVLKIPFLILWRRRDVRGRGEDQHNKRGE